MDVFNSRQLRNLLIQYRYYYDFDMNIQCQLDLKAFFALASYTMHLFAWI